MKKIILLSISILSFSFIFSQEKLAKDYKQDFVTPDHPAFKILDIDPSVILRPSNIKEFSSITSDYFKKPAYVIPKAFSLEFAPALLLRSNKLNLDDYAKHYRAYGCRISVATHAVDDKWQKNEVGIGFRMTVIDKGDFRKDTAYLNRLDKIIDKAFELSDENMRQIDITIKQEPEAALLLSEIMKFKYELKDSTSDAYYELRGKLREYISARREALSEAYKKNKDRYKEQEEEINILRKEYLAENWNATRLDWGVAAKLITPDTTFSKNLRYDKFSFWLTGAVRIGEKIGKKNGQNQLMIGVNINHEYKGLEKKDSILYNIDSTTYNSITYAASLRYYLGTNRIKAFVEAQLSGSMTKYEKHLNFEEKIIQKSTENKLSFLLNAGAELNVSDGIWIIANLGYNIERNFSRNLTASNLVYKLDFRFNLPQKFKLF
jgi:opacity protein-like surface antigen